MHIRSDGEFENRLKLSDSLWLLRFYSKLQLTSDSRAFEDFFSNSLERTILMSLGDYSEYITEEERAELFDRIRIVRTSISKKNKPFRRNLKPGERVACLERDLYRCVKCSTHVKLQVDHIIEVCDGGSDELSNLQTLCKPCHISKTVESRRKRNRPEAIMAKLSTEGLDLKAIEV